MFCTRICYARVSLSFNFIFYKHFVLFSCKSCVIVYTSKWVHCIKFAFLNRDVCGFKSQRLLFQLRSFFLSSVCVLAASASSWSFRNCEKIFLFSNHFLRQTMIKWWLWWWCWCTNGTQMEPNQQLTQNHTSRKKIKLTVEDKSLLVQLTVFGPKKFYNTGYSLPRANLKRNFSEQCNNSTL